MIKRVLVTGGAGFIGSHLVTALLNKNYQVRVLDNLSSGHREWLPEQVDLLEGDVRNLDDCRQAVSGVTGVFHCAAMSRSAPSADLMELCTEVNVLGTQNMLLAARDEKVTKFIYSGSSTYYGSQETPHHEFNTPMQFLNAYALSKYVGEQYCLLFDKIYALPCTILRYFNVYGPRQPEVGAYALVLGIFLNRFAKGEPLEIHGDGSQRRDFIHVSDVASANLAAWESPLHGEVFNVGSGVNISIQELADRISNNQIYGERRKADAANTLADITRIQTLLSWRPTISFEEGLASMMSR